MNYYLLGTWNDCVAAAAAGAYVSYCEVNHGPASCFKCGAISRLTLRTTARCAMWVASRTLCSVSTVRAAYNRGQKVRIALTASGWLDWTKSVNSCNAYKTCSSVLQYKANKQINEKYTFNLVVESFLFIFFRTNWKLVSMLSSASSMDVAVKDKPVKTERGVSFTAEKPTKGFIDVPKSSALRPLLDGC